MFEDRPEAVEALMNENVEFRRLLQKHRELDKKVHDAEIGTLPMDDMTLSRLKKEKLWAKDKLTHMMDSYGVAPASG